MNNLFFSSIAKPNRLCKIIMNNLFFSIALIFCFGFTLSCTAQNSETRSLGNFEGIATSEGIKVTARAGSKNEARIKVSGIDIDRVNSNISYGMLKFSIEGNNRGRIEVEVELTYTGDLKELVASSAGRLIIEDEVGGNFDVEIKASSAGKVETEKGVKADELDLKVSSSGRIELGTVSAQSIDAEASSSGKITLSGSANDLDVEASSAGSIYGEGLKAKDVRASVSSGGGAKVYVDGGRLNANASSGGWLKYKGSPSNTNINKSSGGSVRAI